MACWATDRFDTVIDPWPPVPEFTGTVPSTVAPLVNVIVPDGLPAPGASTATVAVNVTGWPKTDGEPEVVSVVVVAALFTDWVTLAEALVTKFGSSLR